jgi:hypothetical protein
MLDPAAIATFADRATAVSEAMHPAEVSINGAAPIAAIITEPRRETMLPDGGGMDEGELIVRIRKTTLPTPPAEQLKLRWRRPGTTAYRNPTWRISIVSAPDLTPVWHLRCIPA